MRRRRRTDAAGNGDDGGSPGRVPEALLERMRAQLEAAGGHGLNIPGHTSPRADGRDGRALDPQDGSNDADEPRSSGAEAANAEEAAAEDDEAVFAVKLQRARDTHAYVNGVLPYVVSLVALLLISTLQVGYYYYALPKDRA